MTRERINAQGEGMVFSDIKEVQRAYGAKKVHLQAKVKVRLTEVTKDEDGNNVSKSLIADTTVGRAMLFDILPDGLPFDLVNRPMVKKAISKLINTAYR
ncbi:hypothetical protein, partial [Oleiphilus sp. HI0043]